MQSYKFITFITTAGYVGAEYLIESEEKGWTCGRRRHEIISYINIYISFPFFFFFFPVAKNVYQICKIRMIFTVNLH